MDFKNITTLIEAGSFMTAKELQLKRELIKLLVSKGHPKYAERLVLLDVVIVPLAEDPSMTAAISFETGTVYISEGFLNCGPQTFNQLDVLLRHELAHNLLMHQIRMIHKFMEVYGVDEETAKHIMHSSLHDLLNVIEDYEISNTRYTQADKDIVRHMILNGREISGLVTEDKFPGWQKLTVIQMFEALDKEVDQIKQDILQDPAWQPDNAVSHSAASTLAIYMHMQPTDNSILSIPVDRFIKTKAFKGISPFFQKLTLSLYKAYNSYAAADIHTIIEEITATGAFKAYTFVDKSGNPIGAVAYTPEDKNWAINILLALAGQLKPADPAQQSQQTITDTKSDAYVNAYNKVIKVCNNNKYDSKTLAALRRHILQGKIDIPYVKHDLGD